ncbi:hypothetical protein B0H16DRAFT_1534475 [Mycena metata]|uniref:RING-type domain-containing protein n=1 Tax=Mycena metata TaxID=1033252 RepID=A0AAD7JAP1_9AGAR|nr:hypothetical protein B0H16DRAFT_1534475 [Mycena metata]
MSCSICLSNLKEPVSVPCGHIYCTECLTSHISATSRDGFTSTCPECREMFNMVRPELSCLPQTFHQYVVPSLRRVYISPAEPSLSKEILKRQLSLADARIQKLEEDKERLKRECERYIAAAQAHARGKAGALRDVASLQMQLELAREREVSLRDALVQMADEAAEAQRELATVQEELEEAQEELETAKEELEEAQEQLEERDTQLEQAEEDEREARDDAVKDAREARLMSAALNELRGEANEAKEALKAMKVKYERMKKHCRAVEASRPAEDNAPLVPLTGKRSSSLIDLSVDDALGASPKRLRVTRPLPRSRGSLPLATPVNQHQHRYSVPGGLGSPFRT